MLDKKSPTLRLLQQMRDEAHRFGLNHHRRRRSKSNTASELVNLPGVGPVTVQKLLEAFGSAEQVYLADTEALALVVGPSMASKILAAIKGSQEGPKA
jgi:excinuclease ABC subunit C